MRQMTLIMLMCLSLGFSGCKKTIHQAASQGDLKCLQRHLDKGIDVNARDRYGRAPLHEAAQTGQTLAAKLLISNGADINAADDTGWTPLHAAAVNGRWALETLELLVSSGADIHARTKDGLTPLHEAARGGDTATIRLLLSKGADINAIDKCNQSAIFWAIFSRHRGAVEFLIEEGADLTLTDSTLRVNPMEFAMIHNDMEITRLLLEATDVQAKDVNGRTVLHRAFMKFDMVEAYKNMIPMLIDRGADVNAKDNDGWTPLDFAYNYYVLQNDIPMDIPKDKELIDMLEAKGAIRGASNSR